MTIKIPSQPENTLSPTKQALLALEQMQAKLDSLEAARNEPIAIIGMSCRFPGGADSPEAFWELLREGRDAIIEVPQGRWDAATCYDPNPEVPGKTYTRHGGFLPSVDQFDAEFFGIAPREALSMDPQQRLLLEVAWEALERANQVPERLLGSLTGVFIGITNIEYGALLLWAGDAARIDAYFGTGVSLGVAAGRLSYVLGLTGPSLIVDTACSASLVATHLAVQSLRLRECHLALAGGVNLFYGPETFINFSRARMLAPDGRCKTFAARADGYGRGEGCGMLVLKRLSDALADGDTILAQIRGSAVNQDGRSGGLTVPNGPSQEKVIRQALAQAGIAPHQVGYIEAHGTGTALGDPIEMGALANVFGGDRQPDNPLVVGSVKSNIGHLESAASVAGLIKVVLALQHEEIPPHLHFEEPNPHIDWNAFPVVVPRERRSWPAGGKRRIGGLSSFSFSGTNAHLVLEEAPQAGPTSPLLQGSRQAVERPLQVLTLSAKSAAALAALAGRYRDHLAIQSSLTLGDISFTAHTCRTHWNHRLSVVAGSSIEAGEKLAAFCASQTPAGLFQGEVQDSKQPKIAFLFTGQGSQYVGMGRRLYATQETFRQALDRCDEILRLHLERPLLEVLYPEPAELPEASSRLDQTAYTQPALFALEYALAALWRSWGIAPALVLGHSIGEYVAACVAGVFSLEEGLRLTAERGRLMQTLCEPGAMLALAASEGRVVTALRPYAPEVAIAAINGPESVVVSGQHETIRALQADCEAQGIETRALKVSHAFHSPLMQPMLEAFQWVAEGIDYTAPKLGLCSNLTGGESAEIATPAYWCRHVREPVQFAAGMETLRQQGVEIFLEIGPKPTLLGLGQQCLPDAQGAWLPSLRPGQDDWQTLLYTLGELYVRGTEIDWQSVNRDYPRARVPVPTYPFQRRRYWLPTARPAVGIEPRGPRHPLLGRRLHSAALKEIVFESLLGSATTAFLAQHRIFQTAVLPAAAHLELILAAGAAAFKSERLVVEDLLIQQMLTLPEAEGVTVQAVLTPEGSGAYGVQIFSAALEHREEPGWTLHSSARLRLNPAPPAEHPELAAIQQRCSQSVAVTDYYRQAEAAGIEHGEVFQAITGLWRGPDEVLGQLRLPLSLADKIADFYLHPVLLDACFQLLGVPLLDQEPGAAYLPVSVERLCLYRRADPLLWCTLKRRTDTDSQAVTADLCLLGPEGQVIATVAGARLQRVSRQSLSAQPAALQDWLYQVQWLPQWHAGAVTLLEPAAIRDRLAAEVTAAAVPFADYGERIARLDRVSVLYLLQAFAHLGWVWQVGRQLTDATCAEQLGVDGQYRRLLQRYLAILAEEGFVRARNGGWEVIREPVVGDPTPPLQALLEQCPELSAEATLVACCGERLAEVLRGTQDPLALLFPEGDLTLLTRLYQDSPGPRLMNRLVQKTILEALADLPQGRQLRLLEIGAGTGGTTAQLLPHLPARRTEYIFTDVSSLFTARAQDQFRAYPFVSYRLLDIEQAPEAQGFAGQAYPIVVAANVLHATRDLSETLAHVQELLAPGGLLVLLEGTGPRRWVDLTFGLTEGWWRFADLRRRPDYPLLAAAHWRNLLQASGFSDVVELSPDPSQQALLVARKAASAPRGLTAPDVMVERTHWLILADRRGTGQALAQRLRARGGACLLAFPGAAYRRLDAQRVEINPDHPEDFTRLLHVYRQEHGGGPQRVVHLWSLDAAPPDRLTEAELAAAFRLGCGGVLHLVQALVGADAITPPLLWLVTRDAVPAELPATLAGLAQSPLWGMGKVIALEHPELRCIRLDLAADGLDEAAVLVEEIGAVGGSAVLAGAALEDQIAWRGRSRYVARLARWPAVADSATLASPAVLPEQTLRLEITEQGTLDNLQLRPASRRAPGPGEVEIQVHYAGLNFRDVLNALGLYPGGPRPLGTECAGVVSAVGEGVAGLAPGAAVVGLVNGSFSRYVTVNRALVAPKPPGLSFAQAATIPIAFLTADLALHQLAGLAPGERVLIHAAAGGLGQAAIQLAQQAGAEIFATASPGKWDIVRALGVRQIFNSRTLEFADAIMAATAGQGVDVVLNSLSGDFIPASLAVLRPGGRFLELGKNAIWDAEQVAAVRPDVVFVTLDLEEHLEVVGAGLARLLERFQAGVLKPLPYTVFPLHQAVSAFRYMQQARHTGKVLLEPAESPGAAVALRADGSYLITGGLGGLGLLVARWLVEHGARRLLLVGRRGPDPAAAEQIRALEQTGAQVRVASADVSQREALAQVLAEGERALGPLRGVIHAAGVLDDGVLRQQTVERFARVWAPKVQGAWHLHTLTQDKSLDFFILFSSAAALLGSAGQANHVAANTFLDALAHYRRARGLTGLAIDWGAWSEIGEAERRKAGERIALQGVGTIAPHQGLTLFEQVLLHPQAQIGVMPVDWSQFPGTAQVPFFSPFNQVGAIPEAPQVDFIQRLEALAADERRDYLTAHVQSQVAQVLGLPSSQSIEVRRGFFDLGMDSLTSMELKNRLQTSVGRPLPATLAFKYPTVEKLVDYLASEVLVFAEPPRLGERSDAAPPALTEVQQMSDAALEALIDQEFENLMQRDPR